MIGHNGAIGAAARDGEPGTELEGLEAAVRAATAAEQEALRAAEAAIHERTAAQKRLLKARRDFAIAEIEGAASVTRADVDAAIDRARTDIAAGAALVVELGNSSGWGRGVDAQLEKARESATGDQLPAVVAIRGHDARSHSRALGVALVIDLTGKLPQPQSVMTAAESARRANARGGRL